MSLTGQGRQQALDAFDQAFNGPPSDRGLAQVWWLASWEATKPDGFTTIEVRRILDILASCKEKLAKTHDPSGAMQFAPLIQIVEQAERDLSAAIGQQPARIAR